MWGSASKEEPEQEGRKREGEGISTPAVTRAALGLEGSCHFPILNLPREC